MELNDKEKKTLKAFPKTGEPITLLELAKATFPSVGVAPDKRGNSWVRNSLRKLVKSKTVTQVARGLYRLNPTRSTATPKRTKKAARKSAAKKTPPRPTGTARAVAAGKVAAAPEVAHASA